MLFSANKTSEYDSSSDPEQLDGGDAPYVLIDKFNQVFYDAVSMPVFMPLASSNQIVRLSVCS